MSATEVQKIRDGAVAWAKEICADQSHGYSQDSRWPSQGKDFDCSSFVISAFEAQGLKVLEAGATYTGNMEKAFLKCGFENVTSKVDRVTGKDIVAGDVILNTVSHVALSIGNGRIAHASGNEAGGAHNSIEGDQLAGQAREEIGMRDYYNFADAILRFTGKNFDASSLSSTSTTATVSSPKIKQFQRWLTQRYSISPALTLDGEYGPKTLTAAIKAFQHELNLQFKAGLIEDGEFGAFTKIKIPDMSIKSKPNYITKILQGMLYCKGYDPKCDAGNYNADTQRAVLQFQKDNGLIADGIAGANTFEKLLK